MYLLDIDVLHAIRHAISARQDKTQESPVVVIAVDEFTHRSAPFAGLPKVMWTPQLAAVQDALLDAGAAGIGWDLILPTSAATYVSDRNFDRELLKSLSRAAKENKIVLGMADIGEAPIKPHPLFSWAAGGTKNLRLLNVVPDVDGVVRRVPVFFQTAVKADADERTPSFARELAQRRLGKKFKSAPDGGLSLNGSRLGGVREGDILINFTAKAANIPTHSLADLHACQAAGKAEYFAKHFSGKIILIGLVLDIEDRKLSSARLYTDGSPPGPVYGCATPPASLLHRENDRATLPGVYLHAAAVNNLIQGDGLESLSFPLIHLPAFVSAHLAAFAAAFLSLPVTVAAMLFGMGVWVLMVLIAFGQALVMPLLIPLAAAFVTLTAVFALRFAFIDKDARFLRKAFASYMSPALVEQLVSDPERLSLNGERREMTFLFTDLAGFTSLIEKQQPEEAVDLLNAYLAEMVDITKRYGGTLDKVVGDALHVMFSAPLDQPDHAERAVKCALEMDRFANEFSKRHIAKGVAFGETRIGINTGLAIIGNFGGNEFFDYTAHGDAINTAARLESVNKQFGTRLAVSGTTASQCPGFSGRPVGSLVLKGKVEPTKVFEPMWNGPEQEELFEAYKQAFELMKQKKPQAKAAFKSLAMKYPQDGLTQYHLDRLNAGETGVTIWMTEK
jgi:adenylate cyclase